MAGRGPAPKPAHLRQRRNKKPGAAQLEAPEKPRVPKLQNPDGREWHKLTRAWWRNVWRSPMASEFLDTDIDGLARIALLVDEYYKSTKASEMTKLMTEIRLQEARFGLSPVDRSRLQWEVAKGEEASRKRQPKQQARAGQPDGNDPRNNLKVVS